MTYQLQRTKTGTAMLNQLFGTDKPDETYALVVVEDEPGADQSLSKRLSEAGYVVRATTCREEGVDLLGQEPLPKGLIIDVTSTNMSAQEFVEKARVRYGHTGLPPVLLLADTQDGETLANLIEVDDYVPKPFETENLLQRVKQLVEKTLSE
jgi:two-component system, OmpR family, response regulator MprA